MVVIGRYRFYIDEVRRLQGEIFSIPKDEWEAMTSDQQWALNKEFLDKAIAANDQIWLTTAPEKVPAGCGLERN
jgi:hypothetical protein